MLRVATTVVSFSELPMNYVRDCVYECVVCVCFVSHKKLKPAGKNNKAAKDEQLGQTGQFSFNSSSLGYVRMLHG